MDQEINYNTGRFYHGLGLYSAALNWYLDVSRPRGFFSLAADEPRRHRGPRRSAPGGDAANPRGDPQALNERGAKSAALTRAAALNLVNLYGMEQCTHEHRDAVIAQHLQI